MAQFHILTISEIEKITNNCVTLTFDVPSDLQSEFNFTAGQYITLKTKINGEDVRRDYSLCSAPNSKVLKVAVKAVENGVFSQYANTQLKSGDSIEVSKPNGRFTYTPDTSNTKTVVAFAAGSGITPIMSIAKSVLESEKDSKFVLVYGNKTQADTMFFAQLESLQSKYNSRFSIQHITSQEKTEHSKFGRIDSSIVNYVFNTYLNDAALKSFYLCGPEQMIHTVSDSLKEKGFEEDQINFELFTTSTTSEAPSETTSAGESKVTVLLDDETSSFSMDAKSTILDAALAEDIDAPYSCQGGICSSCIARITEGEVSMRQNNILTESELAEGLILTCQAHPKTANVSIDFDDV
ncbi:MAG: flavodoxin reductase [Bacteroidetes bacterium MedPE-SWsnd-G2]|nr:MAG: flavodoxin reductase [Bacteroidetes bacterium MedPE-SWsnd-G2]